MATLDDLLTAQKNGVVAINNLNQTTAYLGGKITSNVLTSSTLVISKPGRLVRVSVIIAGAAGTAYNANTTAGASASNALFVIPATVGVHDVGVHFENGLVITPGAGQSVNVTYSLD